VEPGPVTVAGVYVAVAPLGKPLVLKPTVPENAPATTETVADLESPGASEKADGDTDNEKSGRMTRLTLTACEIPPPVQVIEIVYVPERAAVVVPIPS